MSNQVLFKEDLKDRVIDQIHYLAEIGDYISATVIYDQYKNAIMEDVSER